MKTGWRDRLGLLLKDISFSRSVCSLFRNRGAQCEESYLAGPIFYWCQNNLKWTVVHDLQNDWAVPPRLNPRCRLMHAQSYSCIGATAFNVSQ